MGKRWGNYSLLGLLTLGALLLAIVGLGNVPLRDFDEGYYGTVAQDTYLRGDWRFPTYHGEGFWLKPPLIVWLMMASYHLGGINEWTSRLPMALLSALAVPLLYFVGRELFPRKQPALYSALVLLTLLPTVRLGRLAMLDGMINTFWLLALLFALKGRHQRRWLGGVGLALGAIALCKGVIVVVLGGLLALILVALGEGKMLRQGWLWFGVAIAGGIVGSWYGLQGREYGASFWQVHFQTQSFDRLTTVVEGNTGPPWYYLLELAKYSAPWLLFMVPGLGLAGRQWREPWAKVALIMGVGFLIIVSAMATKLPWYGLPSYPFFALMAGAYLDHLTQKQTYPVAIGYLLALVTVAVTLGGLYGAWSGSQPMILAIAVPLALGLGYGVVYYFRRSPRFIWGLVGGLYGALLVFVTTPLWNWEVNEAFAVPPVGALIRQNVPPQTPVYTSFAYSRPSLDFYGDRRVVALDENGLQEKAQGNHYLLLDPEIAQRLTRPEFQSLGQASGFTLYRTQP